MTSIQTKKKVRRFLLLRCSHDVGTCSFGPRSDVLIPIALIVLLHRRHGGKKYVLPHVLPLGWVATTTKLTSCDAKWFLLAWARKIGYTFRIRIPYPGPVIVVGDSVVAREILNDPLTTKPNGFYGPIDAPTGAASIFKSDGNMRAKRPPQHFHHLISGE